MNHGSQSPGLENEPRLPADWSAARRQLFELRAREWTAAGITSGIAASAAGAVPVQTCLVPIRPGGSRPPLFCFHDITGQVLAYRDLAGRVDPDWPIYGVQAPGADGRIARWPGLPDLLRLYVEEILKLDGTGPYYLLGGCAGGLIAYEVARELVARGRRVAAVFLVDPVATQPDLRGNYRTPVRRLLNLVLLESPAHMGNVLELSGRDRWKYLKQRITHLLARGKAERPSSDRVAAAMLEQALRETLHDCVPGPFAGRVVLFRSRRRLPVGTHPNVCRGWDRLPIGQLVVHHLRGFVGFVIKDPKLRRWVHLLNQELQSASRAAKTAGT